MSAPWSNDGLLYMFPLFGLILAVLARLRQSLNVSLIVIVPFGPALWFPELWSLTQCNPIPLWRQLKAHPTRRIRAGSALPALGPTRVASLTKIFVAKGHSKRAAEFMVKSLRPSLINLYESHWAALTRYCQRKGINVFNVRSAHFSRYIVTLFDADVLPNTIFSHRTSIASVLRHWRYDPATDP